MPSHFLLGKADDTVEETGASTPTAGRYQLTALPAGPRRPTFARSTRRAVSTAARSGSFPMTTPTVRRKRSSRRASWSRATKFS
jgi:hypothetical protein